MLQAIDQHYISGYGDRTASSSIRLKKRGIELANAFLEKHEETKRRVEKVINLIHGFETPFGLELLATVHRVMDQKKTQDDEVILKTIQAWNPRKKQLFVPRTIKIAKDRLLEMLIYS